MLHDTACTVNLVPYHHPHQLPPPLKKLKLLYR